MPRRPLLRLAASIAAAVLLVACGGGDSGDSGGQQTPARLRPYLGMAEGLCRAAAEAGAGDAERAEQEFVDRAHALLHDLAREAGERDRSGTARLLEAKQAVESSLATGEGGDAALAERLEILEERARVVLRRLGAAPPPCAT